MYKAKFINPYHDKKSKKRHYTLVMEDEDGILPKMRIEKAFDEKLTDEELKQECEREILNQLINNEIQIDKPLEEPKGE